MKQIISLLLVFTVFLGLCSGTVYADEPDVTAEDPEEVTDADTANNISLRYDDRYTFSDAKKIEVLNENYCIEVLGKTIRGAGVTDSPVTIVVDGEEYRVTVEKAVIDVFVLDGQSNASGNAGRHDKDAIVPDKGYGYYWSEGTLKDSNEYVKAVEKKNPRLSVGLWPAFEAEWYALTGEKAVVMNISQNGRPIQHWTSVGYYETGVSLIEECIDSIDTDLFTIAGGGFFWYQGESNTDIYEITEQMRYTTTEEYISEFNVVRDAYISTFASKGIDAFAGIFAIRNWGNLLGISKTNEYSGPRAALQYLANSSGDVFIASSLVESWDKTEKKPFSYTSEGGYEVKIGAVRALYAGVHFNQSGYDILGLDAADNLYSGWRCGMQADDFVLYGQNANNVYEEGSVIYLDDNLRIIGAANSGEKFAAQLVAVALPRGDACYDLRMKLARCSDGSEVAGVMTNSGYFPDVSAVDEDMTLTVSMGDLSRSYTISKHAHKLLKGPESKKGSFELTDKNGDPIDSAGLGELVYVRSRAVDGSLVNGISIFETVSGKALSYNNEGTIEGTEVFSFKMPAVDVTVRGKYMEPGTDNIGYRFVISFDKNADEAKGNMRTMSGSVGSKSIIALNKFEFEGHTFCGWNTEPDGSGTDIEDGARISEFVIQNYSNITLYAQWMEDAPEIEEIPVAEEEEAPASQEEP